jgi:hypothetical protein
MPICAAHVRGRPAGPDHRPALSVPAGARWLPEMAFSSEVLPTPLRAHHAGDSPRRSAFRSETPAGSGCAVVQVEVDGFPAFSAPQIDFDHALVALTWSSDPFGQHRAFVQHRHLASSRGRIPCRARRPRPHGTSPALAQQVGGLDASSRRHAGAGSSTSSSAGPAPAACRSPATASARGRMPASRPLAEADLSSDLLDPRFSFGPDPVGTASRTARVGFFSASAGCRAPCGLEDGGLLELAADALARDLASS